MELLPPTRYRPRRSVQLGFVPLIDCAPLVVAKERGLFAAEGVDVDLVRQPGWASVRDKLVTGELDGSHAISGLAFSTNYGLGCARCDCVTALLLNTNGDAITISSKLWDAGVRDAGSLATHVRSTARDAPLTFGVVHPYSSHNFLFQMWLRGAGLEPGRDVRIVTAPPSLMGRNLRAGHLDGFCVGEPWNTVAAEEGAGHCLATSADICPTHPEKALLFRSAFATSRHSDHMAVVRALAAACRYCDAPRNHRRVAALLAMPRYLGLPEAVLAASFQGTLLGTGTSTARLHRFAGDEVNRPSSDKASWILTQMARCGIGVGAALRGLPSPGEIFRSDLYDEALCGTGSAA